MATHDTAVDIRELRVSFNTDGGTVEAVRGVGLQGAPGGGLAPFFEQVVASPHSVVTAHLIDEAGQPTVAARDEILAFFARRLMPPAGGQD